MCARCKVLLALVSWLRVQLKQCEQQVERLGTRLYELGCKVDEMTGLSGSAAVAPGQTPSLIRAAAKRAQAEADMKRAAELGARSLSIRNAGDSFQVEIDGRGFRLPLKLAALLEGLAAEYGPSDDHLVGWKGREHILQWMAKKTHTQLTHQALNTLVWRLRNELRLKAHLHRDFVQTNRATRSLRFALNRSKAP